MPNVLDQAHMREYGKEEQQGRKTMTEQTILSQDERLTKAFDSRYRCREMLKYFPWLLTGASPASLEPRIVYPLIRHAQKCRDCESWIQNELGFKSADDLEKFFRQAWSHQP